MRSAKLETNSDKLKKLDGSKCAGEFNFTCYGVRIRVRADDSKTLARVVEHLPPEWSGVAPAETFDREYALVGDFGQTVAGCNAIYADSIRLGESSETNRMFELFESNLKMFVAEFAPKRVFVHAGVVGWKNRAILIPGRSFSGKTTLVSELVRAGATYYSDEYALLDEFGLVHPFAQPLAMRENGSWKQRKQPVETFGGKAGTEPLPIGLVVVSRYREGARWHPKALSPGLGILSLFSNTVSARRQPEAALDVLQKATENASFIKGARGAATEAAATILKNLNKKIYLRGEMENE